MLSIANAVLSQVTHWKFWDNYQRLQTFWAMQRPEESLSHGAITHQKKLMMIQDQNSIPIYSVTGLVTGLFGISNGWGEYQ